MLRPNRKFFYVNFSLKSSSKGLDWSSFVQCKLGNILSWSKRWYIHLELTSDLMMDVAPLKVTFSLYFKSFWTNDFWLQIKFTLYFFKCSFHVWRRNAIKMWQISETDVRMIVPNTGKYTVISPDFLVWKFCGKAQFPHSFGRWGNCTFPQNFHARKSGEITVFFAVKSMHA